MWGRGTLPEPPGPASVLAPLPKALSAASAGTSAGTRSPQFGQGRQAGLTTAWGTQARYPVGITLEAIV